MKTPAVLLLLTAVAAGAQVYPGPEVAISNALQLRLMAPTNAALRHPVRLRAVVTAVDRSRTVFLQDAETGTFMGGRNSSQTLRPGDLVEVTGASYQGLFLPGINASNVVVLGRAELPPPVPATYDELLSGRLHYRRVEVRGIVRSIEAAPTNRTVITLALGPRKLEVSLQPFGDVTLPPLVDARVRVTGLAAGYINDKRQLVAPQIFLNDPADIHVEQPPPADPFETTEIPLAELLNFNPQGISNHRVHTRGVVTHQRPGEALFLRDGNRGLLVQTRQDARVQPGDVVEVAGFPAMGTFSAYLEDAEFRRVSSGPEPPPVVATVARVARGTNDTDLVTLSARLLEVLQTPTESFLVLREGDVAFNARLPRTPLELRNGSQLRLTGVCRVATATGSTGFRANPGAFELLLRSPADIAVLSAPTWWTARRLAVAAVGLLVLSVSALAWAALLRRRVAEQTEVIRRKVEREAVLEERQRLAREMHDTLAQGFSGLGFQLEALAARLPDAPAEARATLDTARQMVRHSHEEFRRSLMNLRAQELERGGLISALPELARQITLGTGIELQFQTAGVPRRLPEAVESNLLRIGQEGLNNAVRHGRPTCIELELAFQPASVQLRVIDNGVGFDPAKASVPGNGHFGLCGLRERVEQIGAQLELRSQPGAGTTILVTVPA